jgi:hypothetical protein
VSDDEPSRVVEDPLDEVLHLLRDRLTERKFRLFNLACVRRVWHLLGDERFRLAVEVSERHADGLASDAEFGRAVTEVKRASDRRRSRERAVYHAVRYTPGSPRAEASGVARHTADLARDAVPLPAAPSVSMHSRGCYGFSLSWDEPVAGQLVTRTIGSGDVLPADVPPEVAEQYANQISKIREDEARDAEERRQEAATVDGSFRAELAAAQAARRAAYAAERAAQIRLLRDLLPDAPPRFLDPVWRSPSAVILARAIYDGHAFERMPELADLLQAESCSEISVLDHCRRLGDHARGCWVLDWLLGQV